MPDCKYCQDEICPVVDVTGVCRLKKERKRKMPSNPKNAYLARLEQEKQDRARIAQYVNERQSLDALIVAINDEFGFGAERINRLISRYIETRIEVADMFMDDRYKNKDKELAYSKAKMDKRLQSIMGPDYPEHDVRYTVNIGKTMYDGGIVIGTVRGGRN